MSSNHKPKTTVYVVRRTNKKDPKDSQLIFGQPGPIEKDYPRNATFVSSHRETAQQFADEMNNLWGNTESYTAESRLVRV